VAYLLDLEKLGFEQLTVWPPERAFYIIPLVAFFAAHTSTLFRFSESKNWV
jgi:hypothetical protein